MLITRNTVNKRFTVKIMFENISWDKSGIEIEKESFRIIDELATDECCKNFSAQEWHVVRRLIHTTADFSISKDVKIRHNAIEVILQKLHEGATIISDSNMIKSGLSVPKLQKFNKNYSRGAIKCFISDEDVIAKAKQNHTTRALAAVGKAYQENLIDNCIFLCGNAPLALAQIIKFIVEKNVKPAAIIGMPVGFVNVCESKELLQYISIPHITLEGHRGGSPLAVAALHGVMENELN